MSRIVKAASGREVPVWKAAAGPLAPGAAVQTNTRNGFLDAVRALALVRVIVWHTYGYAWLSYIIASMPAMFFLAGSLAAQSMSHASALSVLYRRFRRLLIPFWVMGCVAVAVMIAYDHSSISGAASFPTKDVLWWVLPLSDPRGSEWGLTWWAPLWYIRCLTWLLLATPLLLWAWRRAGLWLLLMPLAGLVVAETRPGNTALAWQIEDGALYGFFWVLGFAYNDGHLARLSGGARAGLCAVFALCAALWALTQDVPGGVVNASYPLHLFVGLAWLFGALTFERAIGRVAVRPQVAGVLSWINGRALTIYLWQAAGLFAMYQILWVGHHSALTRVVLALPIVLSITFLATLLLGWVEDVAAGRRPQLWPTRATASSTKPKIGRHFAYAPRPAIFAGALFGVVALFLAADNISRDPAHVVQPTAHTVPPSGAGLHYRAQVARIGAAPPARATSGHSGKVGAEELQTELDAWRAEWKLAGVAVSLRRESGEGWTGAAGEHEWGSTFDSQENYSIASVTKTFTAALIMRLAEEGRLDLDDPASMYVPEFPDSELFTIRQLLQHTSGLVLGDELPTQALAEAAQAGLQFEPGTAYLYSRAGYYLLGLVIENVLDEPYGQALHREFLDPLGLGSTFMDDEVVVLPYSTHPYSEDVPAGESEPSSSARALADRPPARFEYYGTLWSSGGLWSTTADLARWAIALWGSDEVLSASSRRQMTTFLGQDFDYTGIATYPFCPCWQEDGALHGERWGFLAVTGTLEYDPIDKLALAVHMSGTILDEGMFAALDDLSGRLRRLVRDRPLPVER